MTALADRAVGHDVVLAHENEKGIYGDTPARCLDIITTVASPQLSVAWDAANFVQCGVRPLTDGFVFFGGGGVDRVLDSWTWPRDRLHDLGRSVEDFGAECVVRPRDGVAVFKQRSTVGVPQAALICRSSRWVWVWTPSTPISTTSNRSQQRSVCPGAR